MVGYAATLVDCWLSICKFVTALDILRLQVLMPRTGAVLASFGTLDRVLTLYWFALTTVVMNLL